MVSRSVLRGLRGEVDGEEPDDRAAGVEGEGEPDEAVQFAWHLGGGMPEAPASQRQPRQHERNEPAGEDGEQAQREGDQGEHPGDEDARLGGIGDLAEL